MSVPPASLSRQRSVQRRGRLSEPPSSRNLTSWDSEAPAVHTPTALSVAARNSAIDSVLSPEYYPSGQKRSGTAQKHWSVFLVQRGMSAGPLPRPLHQSYHQLLSDFAFFLADYRKSDGDPLAPGTIGSYVSTIRSRLSLETGVPIQCDPIIGVLLKRLGATAPPRRNRIAAPKQLIWDIFTDAGICMDVRVAILVGFSAMLRVSEYTSASMSSFVSGSTLKRCDIVVHDRFIRLDLHHTKTDVMNQGQFVYIYNHPGPFSAYTVFLKYLRDTAHRPAGSPVFMMDAVGTRPQRFVTRHIINACLKMKGSAMGMEVTYLSSHSLRIGGATALADAGVPDRDIQFAGRWRSDTFLRYIRVSLSRLSSIAEAVYIGPMRPHSSFPTTSGVVVGDILDHTPASPSH